MATLIRNNPSAANKYDRESVERALSVHYPEPGQWSRSGNGYDVATRRGIITLRSVREAAIFVWACADTKHAAKS